MASEDVGDHHASLDALISALTDEELLLYRAESIDTVLLGRFPALFSLATPSSWVQLPQLQEWLVRRAHINTTPTPMTPRNPPIKLETVKSENDVLDLTTPTPSTRRKRAHTRRPLVNALQDVIVISSDSETEMLHKKVKIDPDIHRDAPEAGFKITRELKVSRVEHIDTLPRCWAMLEERVAYVLDLSAEGRKWVDDEGDAFGMDWAIREHDQDNWGGSGGHRNDVTKCPQVSVLGQRCQHILLKCQGCYVCEHLDPDLLRDCVRRDYDGDQMRHVWEAERQINEAQGSSVNNVTAVFYNHIKRHVCMYEGVECPGTAVLRAWKKNGQSLDGKDYFVGCSAWKQHHPDRMHRFLPIPYNVDQEALLELIQNHGELPDGEAEVSATCALVVPRRIGAKMKQCPYPHSQDGQIVAGKMVVRACAAAMDIYVPLDKSDHRACVIPRTTPHNHPAYPERKPSAHAKELYSRAVSTFGAMGATVGKVDKAASTSTILGGISPPKLHPGLGQRRTKQRIIKKLKDREAPEGFGLGGVLARKELQKNLPVEKQYIQRVSDTAGIQLVVTMLPRLAAIMHNVRASLHDNTYKRTFGKWKEWEVVVWDDRLDMRITVARIYCDSETADAFELIWTAFHEVLEEVTGKPLKLWAFHQDGKFLAYLMDGDAGQVIGLGKYLCKINDPAISGIHENDPAILVQYILKTCWTHCTHNLDTLATKLEDPADIKYIRSFEHMETDEQIEAFREWCRIHRVKAVRDWYENKIRHRWYLPSLNRHLSRIRGDHWALVPKNTNFGESAHAHTNFYTGTGHSLLSAIDAAYMYDLKREEEMLLAEENCLLNNPRNTVAHRMQHNTIRAAGRAQAALSRSIESDRVQELEEVITRLAAELESRRPPSLLTQEERKASLERTRILQAREELLHKDGIKLRRGRKSKNLPIPSTQPLSHDGLTQNLQTVGGDILLDPELDPFNMNWTSGGGNEVDFWGGLQADINVAGPSHFSGSLNWHY